MLQKPQLIGAGLLGKTKPRLMHEVLTASKIGIVEIVAQQQRAFT